MLALVLVLAVFAAAQAAQKSPASGPLTQRPFAAAQAAQKSSIALFSMVLMFAAAQAAQKNHSFRSINC